MKRIVKSVCCVMIAALLFTLFPLKSIRAFGSTLSLSPKSTLGMKVILESPGKSYVLQGVSIDPDAVTFTARWMLEETVLRTDVYNPQSEDLFWLVYAPAKAEICVLEIQNTSEETITLSGFDFSVKVVSGYGEIMDVSDIVDINEPLDPEAFWDLFPVLDLPFPDQKIQQNKILRQFFDFGFINTQEFGFDAADETDKIMNVPVRSGMLGKTEEKDNPYIIAEDIKFNPYMKRHSTYSSRYYPRRMHDYLERYFIPAVILTDDPKYLNRMEELLSFLQYSQWQEDGSNAFVKEVYPDEYALHPDWFGGFDYLFDWEWKDGYGYLWNLHESDHHVSSSIAGIFVMAYQMTGNDEYLKTAYDFVYNQFSRYGFHKGVYQGQTYYWTEYNPTGLFLDNPINDATDNIQTLTASALAKVGYFTEDPQLKAKFLELAKGMLWYMVREYDYDGFFYYDGAENPINPRRSVSHDSVCLRYAFTALAYLYKAGADIDLLLKRFDEIDKDFSQKSATLTPMGDVRIYKLYEGEPVEGKTVEFTSFIMIKNGELEDLMFSDIIPPGFKSKDYINLRFSKLNPPNGNNPNYTIGEDLVLCMKKNQLAKGVRIPFKLERGDVIRVSYEVTCTKTIEGLKPNSGVPRVTGKKMDDKWIKEVSVTTKVKAQMFNMPFNADMTMTSENFLSMAAKTNFPFEDEINVVIVDQQQPRCIPYRESAITDGTWHMLKPLVVKVNRKCM